MNDDVTERSTVFASRRERRLWIWTLLVVVAIYSTLGLARTLAGMLGDDEIIAIGFFLLGCFLVVAAVVSLGLRVRPSGLEIAVAFGIAAAYVLVFVRMAIPAERSHLVEYGVVAVFIYEALLERRRQGRRVPVPGLLAIALATLIGMVDETIQGILPSRVFGWIDILFNLLAAVMAVSACSALRWARRTTERALARRRARVS